MSSSDDDLLLPGSGTGFGTRGSPGSATRKLRNFTATANLSDTSSEDEIPARPPSGTAIKKAPGKTRPKLPDVGGSAAPSKAPPVKKKQPVAGGAAPAPGPAPKRVAPPPPAEDEPPQETGSESSEINFHEVDGEAHTAEDHTEDHMEHAPPVVADTPPKPADTTSSFQHYADESSPAASLDITTQSNTTVMSPGERHEHSRLTTATETTDVGDISLNLDTSAQRTPAPASAPTGDHSILSEQSPPPPGVSGRTVLDTSPRSSVAALRAKYAPPAPSTAPAAAPAHSKRPPSPEKEEFRAAEHIEEPTPSTNDAAATVVEEEEEGPKPTAPDPSERYQQHAAVVADRKGNSPSRRPPPPPTRDEDEDERERDPALDDILPPARKVVPDSTVSAVGVGVGAGRQTPERGRVSRTSPAPADPEGTFRPSTYSVGTAPSPNRPPMMSTTAAHYQETTARISASSATTLATGKPPSAIEGVTDRSRRDLLLRAHERLQRRESGSTHLRGNSPSVDQRCSGGAAAYGRTHSKPDADTASRDRLVRENQRLTEELSFIQKDNQRLKQGLVEGHASEAVRLRTLFEESEAHRKDAELNGARVRLQLEAQLKDSADHEKALKEELRAYSATLEQFESVCAEKDQQLTAEKSSVHKLKQDVRDKELELQRVIQDSAQHKEDSQLRFDRLNELLEDAKKQRSHLLELNEKFGRDKDAAMAERRRAAEELKAAQLELARQSERYQDEVAASRRETERYKVLMQDKERVLNLRVADEQRSKDHYHSKMVEIEEQLNASKTHHQEVVKAIQDEHKRQMDATRADANKAISQCRTAEAERETLEKKFDERFEIERQQMLDEMQGLLHQLERENKELREQNGELRDALNLGSGEKEAALANINKLKQEKEGLEQKVDSQDQELSRVTEALESLLLSDDRVQQEREESRREIEQYRIEIANMRDDVAMAGALEEQLQELSLESERLSEECGRLAKDRSELWTENHRLETEVAQWRSEAQELRAALKGRGVASARSLGVAPNNDFTN